MKTKSRLLPLPLLYCACLLSGSGLVAAQDTIISVDYYIPNVSIAPSMHGETASIYVRERIVDGADIDEGDVVLFVHGAGTPAEVAFDVSYPEYSWMEYVAAAGFDAFSMDTTGYGRSTRPHVMNDICNLSERQQADFVPTFIDEPCPPSYPFAATTIASDWDDINAVVDWLRDFRDVEKVHMVAWSLGGPRAAGYAAQYPDKVGKLVLLAPAYGRDRSGSPPDNLPAPGAAFTKQSANDFTNNWNRQVGCDNQYEANVKTAIWQDMLASDPVGATWGTGIRRAPRTTTWGWNKDMVAATHNPMLIISPTHDAQVRPASVRALYEDLGAAQKVLLDLGCTSHNAMWETNRVILFDATVQWLRDSNVDGTNAGEIRRGY